MLGKGKGDSSSSSGGGGGNKRRFNNLSIATGAEQPDPRWQHSTDQPLQTWHHLFARSRIAFLWNTLLNAYDTCGGRIVSVRELIDLNRRDPSEAARKAMGRPIPNEERVAELQMREGLLLRCLRAMAMAFGRYSQRQVDALFRSAATMNDAACTLFQVRMLWSPWNIVEGPRERSDATGGNIDDFSAVLQILLDRIRISLERAMQPRPRGAAASRVFGASTRTSFDAQHAFSRTIVTAQIGPAIYARPAEEVLSVYCLLNLRRRMSLLLNLETLTNRLPAALALVQNPLPVGLLPELASCLEALVSWNDEPALLFCRDFWETSGQRYAMRAHGFH